MSTGTANQANWQDKVRNRGHRGGVIPMHRALARYVLSPADMVTAVLMVLLLTFVWFLILPYVCHFWRYVMEYGIGHLPLHAELRIKTYHVTPLLRYDIPHPMVEAILPDAQIWRITAFVTVAMFVSSYFLPSALTPVIYLTRGVLFLQVTALVYFAVMPAEFPHTPSSYLEGLFVSEIALISLVPLLYGFTYFIFQFSLPQKVLLTVLTMLHLTVFSPLQILLQALVLQKTVLFMPVLYIVFGLPLEVLIIIAIYSWGMTWHFRALEARGQG